jgi:putative addiction module component (TIGR02574 family)
VNAAADILRQALQLPTAARAEVAAELIASLDGEPDEGVEQAWGAEIERRARRALAGEGAATAWSAVRERLRSKNER